MMPKPEFKAFLNSKEVQAWLFTQSNEGTHATYSSALFNYWQNSVSKEFPWASTEWRLDLLSGRLQCSTSLALA
jgi:hypothetical protein